MAARGGGANLLLIGAFSGANPLTRHRVSVTLGLPQFTFPGFAAAHYSMNLKEG